MDTHRSLEERNRLVITWMPLVDHVMARMVGIHDSDKDDCRSIGYLALIRAADKWKEDKGASMKTYAYACIRYALIDYIRSWKGSVHTPHHMKWHDKRRKPTHPLSQNQADGIMGREEDPAKVIADDDMKSTALQVLKQMDRSDRDLIRSRIMYGRTLRQVGRSIGTSKTTAKKRCLISLDKLRDCLGVK